MINFSKCAISKAIKYGTNLSCIKGRTIVCKVIKGFVVNYDNNIVMFEKGDIIVCSPNMNIDDGRCIGLYLSEEIYIKRLSPDSFIKYVGDEDKGDFWQYKTDCSLEQFKERFEVLDEETAALESCIEKSKKCYDFLMDKKTSVYCVQKKYQSKANFRQGALGVTLLIMGVISYIAVMSGACFSNVLKDNTQVLAGVLIPMFILVSLLVGGILCLFLSEKDIFKCFESKKTPLLDKAEEEYKEHYKNTVYELAVFRRKADWICP